MKALIVISVILSCDRLDSDDDRSPKIDPTKVNLLKNAHK